MSRFSNSQVGSILSFVSVAIGLVLLVSGVIYFVNQRAETARKDEASKIASQPSEDVAKEDSNPINEASSEPARSDSGAVSNANLPETGIEADIISMIAVGMMTASFVYFVNSRRNLKLSL